MREIKFRAWDKYKSKMHYLTDSKTEIEFDSSVSFIPVMWECVVYDENGKIQEFFGSHERHDYDDYNWNFDETGNVLMQYTGLKDINGKEIYEGDILAHIVCDYNGGADIWEKVEVVFEEGAFKLKDLLDGEPYTDFMEDISALEVIGNIYENPELLLEGGVKYV